jgi:hypothetical protein
MSRQLIALMISSALVFGNVSTSAWSAPDSAGTPDQSVAIADNVANQSPLPPAGAAGIKEAQGFENSAWLGLGLVAAIVIVAWILLDDDDDDDEDEGPSTGT